MNYYSQIKSELINNEAYKRVKDYSKNRSDLRAYYNVGKLLIEAQGGEDRNQYGNKLIAEYSERLTLELGKGYSVRNLYNMRLFYLKFRDTEILQAMPAISWTHYAELLHIEDINKIQYYINATVHNGWSYRALKEHIKNQDYERLPDSTKEKLVNKQPVRIQDTIKDPVLIKSQGYQTDTVSEKILQQLILEDLSHFLTELGAGFTFIGEEYKIKVNNRDNYIDLLLFNIIHNCYVVVELKVTELKAEHIGQVQKYMKAIDGALKTPTQSLTVGIVITRHNNQFIKGYCSDERIFGVEWRLR